MNSAMTAIREGFGWEGRSSRSQRGEDDVA